MTTLYQQLNLTSLPAQMPALVEAARQQLSYAAFLEQVLTAEVTERQAQNWRSGCGSFTTILQAIGTGLPTMANATATASALRPGSRSRRSIRW
jgi:hypothetical protein